MLSFRVIACLDVRGGRVVKGVSFSDLRDVGDPAQCAERYEQQGVDEVVLLDISATAQTRAASRRCVAAVREKLRVPLTVGGGIRSLRNAAAMLQAGADKVSVNTAAIESPELIGQLASQFGSQCVVVAIDARIAAHGNHYELLSHAGTKVQPMEPVEWAQRAESLGAGELLLTSWDRDGTGAGYDHALLERITSRVRIPVVASGGAKHAQHLAQAQRAGASAGLVASILHDRKATIVELKHALAREGISVRL